MLSLQPRWIYFAELYVMIVPSLVISNVGKKMSQAVFTVNNMKLVIRGDELMIPAHSSSSYENWPYYKATCAHNIKTLRQIPSRLAFMISNFGDVIHSCDMQ